MDGWNEFTGGFDDALDEWTALDVCTDALDRWRDG